jgi:SAM-dependent methyltransferase
VFRSYEVYVARQKAKLAKLDLSRYDVNYRRVLRERLKQLGLVPPGARVLCLGARLGTEVKAFLDLGCFAVGIDLNPGPANRYVLHGDFHDLQFAPGSADVIFTNSLDHVYSLDRLLAEISRVLKPGGLLIVEAGLGSSAGNSPGHYESFFWSTIDDLLPPFERAGFTLLRRHPFVAPWRGEQLCFEATV